jgi:tryptophan-rich sensory protein
MKIFLCNISSTLSQELFLVVLNLLFNLSQMILEICYYLLSFSLLSLNNALMILLQGLILVLILTCQHLIFA